MTITNVSIVVQNGLNQLFPPFLLKKRVVEMLLARIEFCSNCHEHSTGSSG